MAETDFSIGTKKFKLSKINAFKQFHIVRRIAPILGEMIPIAAKLAKKQGDLGDDQLAALGPIMTGLSKLSDADADMVLIGLLSAVEMFQDSSGNWARVAANDMIMFNDLELPVLLQAAGRSFMYNMSGFFAVLPQVS